ncbi:MAG TPA: arsinothricin resistance N-acetyltransferase ArsN1 family B [Acidimicrobiia bacterium]|jgi:phosphinothricin acetyltransferase|nr:arsinothricin resistance N-acetyltransferase ArsN1 family B [Acidimicrobiia bacterium]
MLIRLATSEDAPGIAAIYEPIVRDTVISFETEPPDAAEMGRRMAEGLPTYPWLVATDNGRLVGYAYASRHRVRAAYEWVAEVSVYVDETQRGRGLGRDLYRTLLGLLTAQGFRGVFAGITLPNPASVGLHESVGFEYLGKYEGVGWKHGEWHDVGWWQRRLGTDDGPPLGPIGLDELDVDSILAAYVNS